MKELLDLIPNINELYPDSITLHEDDKVALSLTQLSDEMAKSKLSKLKKFFHGKLLSHISKSTVEDSSMKLRREVKKRFAPSTLTGPNKDSNEEILKYEIERSDIKKLQETKMIKIEDTNVCTDWDKAVLQSRKQEQRLKQIVTNPFRNQAFSNESLIHLFEGLQFIKHDQIVVDDERSAVSIMNFGFMKSIGTCFKKMSKFSLALYDIENKRCIRFMCKPSVLSNTLFLDDDLEIHHLQEIFQFFTNQRSSVIIVMFSVRCIYRRTRETGSRRRTATNTSTTFAS